MIPLTFWIGFGLDFNVLRNTFAREKIRDPRDDQTVARRPRKGGISGVNVQPQRCFGGSNGREGDKNNND